MNNNKDLRLENDKLDELREITPDMKDILLSTDLCLQLTIASIANETLKNSIRQE